MKNIFKILIAFVFCSLLTSCGGEDDPSVTPIRDFAEQYAADLDSIDKYIDTHYMTVNPTNFDVTFTKIPTGGTQQSIRTQTQYPLKDTLVKEDGIEYKIYFIKFREGDPVNGKRPTQVDSIHIAYRGIRLTNDQFDAATNPVWFGLQDVITGWNHIIPNFKTGTYTTSPGPNPITFNDFGAGVMFLPSGVAYYNTGAGSIPSYAPIIFSFKLYELRYRDHDRDGILSKDERNLTDFSPSNTNVLTRWKEDPFAGYDYDGNGTLEIYDTDGDGVPNMLDIDDDGDGYQTKFEIKDPLTGLSFSFANIPTCSGTIGKKKHLDKNCN
ncbi:FKBP-type peptidylprolyl isomerase [Flavobacterium sp.]|uniref:FKBP-type peptidyl-prolyl cis-trans isomerase n=1 Tax=Flavobacterium sp. TaxID=239 RepID=UPI0026182143|nr:FKBP-type peptidylprolyl isomerase [Flavobacterium sp.]